MANIDLAAALWLSMLYAPDEPLRLEEFLADRWQPRGVGQASTNGWWR